MYIIYDIGLSIKNMHELLAVSFLELSLKALEKNKKQCKSINIKPDTPNKI